jgi:hypothetical protein
MRGIDSDMPIKDAIKTFFASCAAAFLMWYAVALLLEKLIPGFVAPFVDLADLGLVALMAAAALAGFALPIVTRFKKIGVAIVVMCAIGLGIALLWFSISGFGTLQAVLFFSIILTAFLSLYAILFAPGAE